MSSVDFPQFFKRLGFWLFFQVFQKFWIRIELKPIVDHFILRDHPKFLRISQNPKPEKEWGVQDHFFLFEFRVYQYSSKIIGPTEITVEDSWNSTGIDRHSLIGLIWIVWGNFKICFSFLQIQGGSAGSGMFNNM